ncbi:MAG: thiamine-phosphate kinase [Nitrososphaerota archaeon]|jgi:thiamine-monophosphate kinase|nr:thiamine-phosphate kinase [Nitrososphaerota archaeon]MDG6941506.1 thiamine-phosphate kinase [Nitrososphaerota archaeon]MDG6951047.1 thiamine-phosphate kinase [Nitrososphaerota archaeon]
MTDELEVIAAMVKAAGKPPSGYTAIGDDVAMVPPRPGRVVMKTDMLVEHTDMPPGMTYRQAARKAVAMCVSDFAAKGTRPDAFMVSLGLRSGVGKGEVDGLARGLRDAEERWGTHLIGGDTNEAEELVIGCSMVGFAHKVVDRAGASPGDVAVVTGQFGLPPAGLKILMAGARAEAHFAQRARKSVLRPDPDIEVGVALAPYLTASMDSSDGLARSLHTLAKASGVGFVVERLPAAEGVMEFAAANALDADKLILEGGEEYVIVGTVKPTEIRAALKAARKAGGELIPLGRATERKGEVVRLTEGGVKDIRDGGWTHLRRS